MDDTKRLFGKILGEVYRLQRCLGVRHVRHVRHVDDATIYGLLHGFEHVIEDELEDVGWVPTEHVQLASDALDARGEAGPESGKVLVDALAARGVDRRVATRVATFLAVAGAHEPGDGDAREELRRFRDSLRAPRPGSTPGDAGER